MQLGRFEYFGFYNQEILFVVSESRRQKDFLSLLSPFFSFLTIFLLQSLSKEKPTRLKPYVHDCTTNGVELD